ncbi:MAG: exopolyphosphatase [Gammaproteobacteria bacterium]|nr:exopolyphosphatase [Gammaproteobacteria bacterium]MDH5800884.1 exopolyphosphatase [Gammaproteobacteria bacterium]
MSDDNNIYAAIDLGSNSFHMIVARYQDGQLHIVDRLREMVRLSAGMDDSRNITVEAQQRALNCLSKFGQRIKDLNQDSVRIVGTNTLRSARNAKDFIAQAEQVLGTSIDIISGMEEARLIYLGVAHNTGENEKQRLVIDIGGGSTELIIGKGAEAITMESLYMGCVSFTQRFFQNGLINTEAQKHAKIAARVELIPIMNKYRQMGWDVAIGTSGTVRAVHSVAMAEGWVKEGITQQALKKIQQHLLQAGHSDNIKLKGLSDERKPVFAGGVAVLCGIFQALELKKIQVSDGALREGLLHHMVGSQHEDVRMQSINHLARRFLVDPAQAERVQETALVCLHQLSPAWNLPYAANKNWLRWAAQLHELGLGVAHSHYHKHGAYIVENADVAGFTQQEQGLLALLVRCHRRKINHPDFKTLPKNWAGRLQKLAIILRLSVLLHRSRSEEPLPLFEITADESRLQLKFPAGWLKQHQLTKADLGQEAQYLRTVNIALSVK